MNVSSLWPHCKNGNILTRIMQYTVRSDGFLAKMQIISYIFIILKHIQVSSQFRKILMLKFDYHFFFLIFFFFFLGGQSVCSNINFCDFCASLDEHES